MENEPFNEDGFCKYCGWESGFEECHILYCGGEGCEYIRNKYLITVDGDEECFVAVDKETLEEVKVYI